MPKHHTEIEDKFDASKVTNKKFTDFCNKQNVIKFIRVSGPDDYYEQGETPSVIG